nr:SxtA [Alexandrium fundyense]
MPQLLSTLVAPDSAGSCESVAGDRHGASGRNELEEASAKSNIHGLDLGTDAFMLAHGWTCGPLLLEFVASFLQPLQRQPMTAEQLAAETNAGEGPVAITLRTMAILGYLDLDPETDVYAVVPGPGIQALAALLRPAAPTSAALRSIYQHAQPPFRVPSSEAAHCLRIWAEHRPTWRRAACKRLALLLDGAVLVPLLTSITYFARWDEEGLDSGKEGALDRLDFSKANAAARAALGGIFGELGVGTVDGEGTVTLTAEGSFALQRCYSYYVPTSYAPLLDRYHSILFENPGWGFAGAGRDSQEQEIHVHRTLNVVGSGAQHQTLFTDLVRLIDSVFAGGDFASQPAFVVDTGCGDGRLLRRIYEHVKSNTPRGKALAEHPLTMVGVDFNKDSRVATELNLSRHAVPHLVLFGDVGKPADIMEILGRKGVDPSRSLHVRSFLDHDQPYVPPAREMDRDSAAGRFARLQLSDCAHLDGEGKRIAPSEMFASLVEHFQRWGGALQGSFGLCMLEVMMLDVPTTKASLNDCVSLHFDVVQCLSRQYMVSPAAFALGLAMAGLLPGSYEGVQTHPARGRYCRVMSQHLVRRPYQIRLAEVGDLPRLARLEELAWGRLGATPEVLRRRLETSPTTCLAVEMDQLVVAVLYTQRVDSADVVDQQKFMQVSDWHSPSGRIMQLIAICSDPAAKHLGVAADLLAFALHLARLSPDVDSVIGVTRCQNFETFAGSMRDYVDEHIAGTRVDPIIGLHTGNGARVVRLVRGFRPEDVGNRGDGVLIQYDTSKLGAATGERAAPGVGPAAAPPPGPAPAPCPTDYEHHEALVLAALGSLMLKNGGTEAAAAGSADVRFVDMDLLDSLNFTDFAGQLDAALPVPVSVGLLFEASTPRKLAAHLHREMQRLAGQADGGPRLGPAPAAAAAPPPAAAREEAAEAPLASFDSVCTKLEGCSALVDGCWSIDVANCSYLGFQWRDEIADGVDRDVRTWGVHPPWTRLVSSPKLYDDVEERCCELTGIWKCVLYPSVTMLNMGVIPSLVGESGFLLLDINAHDCVQTAARLCKKGATVVRLTHNDAEQLEHMLSSIPQGADITYVCDGVYSTDGELADLPAICACLRARGAKILVDDSHGCGVLGRNPDSEQPLGYGGGGVVEYFGLDYAENNIIYAGQLSKAFNSPGGFVGCARETDEKFGILNLAKNSNTLVFTGPICTAGLSSAKTTLDLNAAEGDLQRKRLLAATLEFCEGLKALGCPHTYHGFPIVNIYWTPVEVCAEVYGELMSARQGAFQLGVVTTPMWHPIAPKGHEMLRFQFTSLHDEAAVRHILVILEDLIKRYPPSAVPPRI